MATKTTNYGLTKPEGSDFYDVGVQNDNMDLIDKQMKANADGIAQLNSDISKKCAYALLNRVIGVTISNEYHGIVFDENSTSNGNAFGTNVDSITIKEDGAYLVAFNLHLQSQSGNQGFFRAQVLVNDSIIATNQQMATGTVFVDPSCIELLQLKKNDTIQFGFFVSENATLHSARASAIKIA